MTLLNAPAYDERKEHLKKNLLIGSAVLFALLFILTFAGFFMGHGWLFTNLPAEHDVNNFLNALEAKDYPKAFAIYNNDPNWEKHPEKYSGYPLKRFIEDWTTESDLGGPIVSHHIDISKTDGSGYFGTGIIVAARVTVAGKPGEHKIFMYYLKQNGNLTYPAVHILEY
jgi:hypothetical protein